MAKISMVAREVNRQALVKKYAAKRAELKKAANAGDYEAAQALQALPKSSQSLQDHWSSEGLCPSVRPFAYSVPRDGFCWFDSWRSQGKLVRLCFNDMTISAGVFLLQILPYIILIY